jgi:uncharacterized protein YaaW (UPF0174 family)
MDELRAALELTTDEELQLLTEILFHRKFNPLDYVCAPDPVDVQSRDRYAWLDAVEQRFRFVAADGFTVLQGRTDQVSYRRVLIQVCRYLKIPYSTNLTTIELEEEIFLFLLNRAWKRLPPEEQQTLNTQLQQSLSQSDLAQQLPFSLRHNPLGILLNGSSVLALTSVVRPLLLQQIARQIALHTATYHASKQAALRAAGAAALKTQVALSTASRGVALNTARYAATRSMFAFLGTALWMWFAMDLGWRAIATNYARIIPVIFTLAQIRLIRSGYAESVCYGLA